MKAEAKARMDLQESLKCTSISQGNNDQRLHYTGQTRDATGPILTGCTQVSKPRWGCHVRFIESIGALSERMWWL